MLTLPSTTASGGSMGKAPVLNVDNLILEESGAITQYLLEKYDTLRYLLPKSSTRRAKVRQYIHVAQGLSSASELTGDIE